jgi:hypothetical protein
MMTTPSLRLATGLWSAAGVLLLLAGSLACSFSYSSQSFSDSSKSSSESSSSSSRSSSPNSGAAYRNDVADYTEAYVVSGGSDGAFLNGIGGLAEKRGITDWESDENTWTGIGRGLGRTAITAVQLGVYKENWGGGDPQKMQQIQQGFDAAR